MPERKDKSSVECYGHGFLLAARPRGGLEHYGNRVGSAMKKSLVTDSAGWCFSVYSASTRTQNAQTERRKLLQ